MAITLDARYHRPLTTAAGGLLLLVEGCSNVVDACCDTEGLGACEMGCSGAMGMSISSEVSELCSKSLLNSLRCNAASTTFEINDVNWSDVSDVSWTGGTIAGVTDNKTPSSDPHKENTSDSDESQADDSYHVCKLTSGSPNLLAMKEISRCKGLLKLSGSGNCLRDNSVSSTNLEDYLRPSIWCWHPERLLPSNSKPLVCWDKSCSGHQGIIKYIIESKKNTNSWLFILKLD